MQDRSKYIERHIDEVLPELEAEGYQVTSDECTISGFRNINIEKGDVSAIITCVQIGDEWWVDDVFQGDIMTIHNLEELVGMEFSFVNSNEGQEMVFHYNYKIQEVKESEYEYLGHVIAEFNYVDANHPDALQSGEIYKENSGMFRIYFHDGWGSDNYVYFSISS